MLHNIHRNNTCYPRNIRKLISQNKIWQYISTEQQTVRTAGNCAHLKMFSSVPMLWYHVESVVTTT